MRGKGLAFVAAGMSKAKVSGESLGCTTHLHENGRYWSFFQNAVEGAFQSTPDGHYLELNFLPMARKLGACRTFAKPFDRQELLLAVREESGSGES